MKKVIIMLLCLSVMLFAAACGTNAGGEGAVPDFTIEAIATEGDVGTTAADLLCTIMDAQEITYELTDGNFTTVGDFKNTESAGWIFYVDGTVSEIAAADTVVAAGAKYELIWGDIIVEGGSEAVIDAPEDQIDENIGEKVNEGADVTPDDPQAVKGEPTVVEEAPAE